MGGVAGIVASAYAAAMAFSLVYLGEHYVVDIAAGVATAAVAAAIAGYASRSTEG